MSADPVQEFLELTEKKREAKAALSDIEKTLRALEGRIISEWTANGTQRINRIGKTIYMRRDLSVRVGDRAKAIAALRELEMEDILSPNAAQLKAWLKECMTRDDIGEWIVDPDMVPESIRDLVTMEEFTRLGVRAG